MLYWIETLTTGERNAMIYPMKPEEYDGIYQFWRSCSGMGLNDLDDSREGMEAFLKRNPTTCFSAWEDGKIVGSILCGHDGRRGYLYHTAVLPDYRGRGIGTELVQAALKGLEEAGIHKAALVVFSRNQAGNAFWERQGFSVREDLTYRNKALREMNRIDT